MKAAGRPLSIIVPVLDEGATLPGFLARLARWSNIAEIIVVDGGSSDRSRELARPLCDRLVASERGRARQMNAGAAAASGEFLLFLHCDTELQIAPEAFSELLQADPGWGFFPVRLDGRALAFRVIERAISLRSRLTRVATGDQAIFVSSRVWMACGGYRDIPLMEDVELSKRLRRISRPMVCRDPVVTSSRRWEKHGIVRTVGLMWYLRLRFWMGEDPAELGKAYHGRGASD